MSHISFPDRGVNKGRKGNFGPTACDTRYLACILRIDPLFAESDGVEFVAVSDRQKTVSREASFVGPGLFSGETATLTIGPAAPNSGITFVREQDGKVATIPALVQNVLNRPRRTCLRNGTF